MLLGLSLWKEQSWISFEEICSILKRTSIRNIIKKKHLIKAIKYKNAPFDRIKDDGRRYLALKPVDCPKDEVMNIAKEQSYITQKMVQQATHWSNLRINRILNHYIEKRICRKDSSYLMGDRYFF